VTKADLANSLAKAVEDLTKKKASEIVDELFEAMQGALAKGDKVQVVGFGTFEVVERAARQGRNPQDPEKIIEIPARRIPVFRAGKGLKDAVAK
jgi:DNA-binding protein HU-beta